MTPALLFVVSVSAVEALSVLCPGHGDLRASVEAASSRYQIPAVMLVSMVRAESSCDPMKVNARTGAVGIVQIMPDGSANVDHLEPSELLDPAVNLDLGARHLRRWWDKCGSLAGALAVFHGRKKCSDHHGDEYVRRVLGMAKWAKSKIKQLNMVRR